MKAKFFSALLLTAFLVVAVLSLATVSAAGSLIFTQNVTTGTYNASGLTGTVTVLSAPTILNEAGANIAPSTSIAGSVVTFTASPDYSELDAGKPYQGTFTLTNTTSNDTVAVTIIKNFCSAGQQNTSGLSLDVDVSNKGDGEDDSWLLLDDMEIDVTFENDKGVDLSDVMIEMGLFDSDGTNVADDLIWTSTDEEKFDAGDVDDSDNADNTFEFQVPSDLEDGDYTLMVKAYSDDDDVCISNSNIGYYKAISIERETDDEKQISIQDLTLDLPTAACDSVVTVTANAYNIGTEDQDAVKFFIYNRELGVSQDIVVTNFDMTDDSKILEFTFKIPANATEKVYVLDLYSMYDYDEDDDDNNDYANSAFNEKSETTKINLNVKGNCLGSAGNASVTAEFSDETPKAVVGRQVVIEATVKNTGSATTNYSVAVLGNTEWSTVDEIDPATFTLGAGESKKVSIYLDISDDAEAGEEQEFTIKVTHGSTSTSQKVMITPEKGFALSGIFDHIKDNWVIYAIVLVNLILIIAIIIVIVKMVGAKSA